MTAETRLATVEALFTATELQQSLKDGALLAVRGTDLFVVKQGKILATSLAFATNGFKAGLTKAPRSRALMASTIAFEPPFLELLSQASGTECEWPTLGHCWAASRSGCGPAFICSIAFREGSLDVFVRVSTRHDAVYVAHGTFQLDPCLLVNFIIQQIRGDTSSVPCGIHWAKIICIWPHFHQMDVCGMFEP